MRLDRQIDYISIDSAARARKFKKELLDEILSKYGEWFEMEGEATPHMIIRILAHMVIKERKINLNLRKCIDNKQSSYNNINS